jgi:hypothetical protein
MTVTSLKRLSFGDVMADGEGRAMVWGLRGREVVCFRTI